MTAPPTPFDLAPALMVLPGARVGLADGAGGRAASASEARRLLESEPVLVAHASLTARRLGLAPPPRSPRLFDVLELFAFARPATVCAPSAVGLAQVLGVAIPRKRRRPGRHDTRRGPAPAGRARRRADAEP